MADENRGVPIGELPEMSSVPDDSLLVTEFLGKAYSLAGSVFRKLIEDIFESMGGNIDDVTEARLTAAIETVLASGKYNGISPIVEVNTDEYGKTTVRVVDVSGIKEYPVTVDGATNAVQYVKQVLTDEQKAQARENIGAVTSDLSVNDPNAAGYVKERTHWKELTGRIYEVIEQISLDFKEGVNFVNLYGVEEADGVQEGGLYTVVYNGTEYECVGKDSGDGVYVGNGFLLGYGNLEDTGEPFCLLAFTSAIYTLFKQDKTAETVTFSLWTRKGWTYHPLEEGYIPDSLRYAVQYEPQTLSEAAKVQARKNIEASVVVKLSGNPVIGYSVTLDGKAITGERLDAMAKTGANVIGIASTNLKFTLPNGSLNDVATGTVFRYENAVASRNPEILEDVSKHWFEFHARINDVDYGIQYDADGSWKGFAVSSLLTFVLTELDGQPCFSYNGQIMPNWAVLELLNMASYTNRPVFCYQKDMRFYKEDGAAIIPAKYTPFSLMLSGNGEHIFCCEQDGYKYTYKVEQTQTRSIGSAATAEKTVAYKTAESKGDDLQYDEDDGLLFLMSGTEKIGSGVSVKSGGVNFTTDKTLTLDPETGVLSVNTADEPEADNTLPITAAAVHTTVGNIEILLETI